MDYEDLFLEEYNKQFPKKKTLADEILEGVQEEFTTTKKIDTLKKEIDDLQSKMKKIRNVRNHRKSDINAKNAEKRKELKKQIEQKKLDLEELTSFHNKE